MASLIAALLGWIAANTAYDAASVGAPDLRFAADPCAEMGLAPGCRIDAYYDHRSATVVLRRGWSAARPGDRGLLLHELVHHVQSALGALDFDSPLDRCRGEEQAISLTAKWMAGQGFRTLTDVRRATRDACAAHFAGGDAE